MKTADAARRAQAASDLVTASEYLQAADTQLAASLSGVARDAPEVVAAIAAAARKAASQGVTATKMHADVDRLRTLLLRVHAETDTAKAVQANRALMDDVMQQMGRPRGVTFANKSHPAMPSGGIPALPLSLPTTELGMLPRAAAATNPTLASPWLPASVDVGAVETMQRRRADMVQAAAESRSAQWGTIGTDLAADGGFAASQGVTGTPFGGQISGDELSAAGVPQNEQNYSLTPYLARGLATDPGEFDAMYRANSIVQMGIADQENMIVGARWEFAPPDIPTDLRRRLLASTDPDQQRLAASLDPDACWRACDSLNLEFATNPSLSPRAMRESLIKTYLCQGFGVQEFALRPDAEIGRRLAWIQDRLPNTVDEWIMRGDSHLAGFIQTDPNSGRRPVVDIRKCIYAARKRSGANWEGISALRSAYGWDLLMAEFLASAILHRQRFGPGVPVVRRHGGANSAPASNEAYRALAQYANLSDAVLELGENVSVEMLQMEAEKGLAEIVEMCARMQREAVGAQLAGLGTEGVGSYAAGDIKSRFMLANYLSTAEAIAESYGSLATAYTALFAPGLRLIPRMRVDGILTRSPRERIEVQAAFADLIKSGVYSADEYRRIADDADIIWDGPSSDEAGTTAEVAQDVAATAAGIETDDVDAAPANQTAAPPAAPAPAAPRITTPRATPKRPLLIAPESTHGTDCGCAAHGDLTERAASPRPNVRVMGRDGRSFATFRALSAEARETSVAWATLAEIADTARDDIASAVQPVQLQHRRAFVEAARPFIAAGDSLRIAETALDFVPAYRAAILPILAETAAAASADMLAEIADQLERATGKRGWTPARQGGADYDPIAWAEANATLLARKINDTANERLANVALSVVAGAPESTLTRYDFGALGHQTAALVAQTVNATITASRTSTAERLGPRITRARYSAILDQWTCPQCEAADGSDVMVGSARYAELTPPNPRCRSLRSSRGGANECRCIWVYLFDTGAANDDVEPPVLPGGGLVVSGTATPADTLPRALTPTTIPADPQANATPADPPTKPLHTGTDEDLRAAEFAEALDVIEALGHDQWRAAIVWGPPACGKSSLSRRLAAALMPSQIVDADDYRIREDGTFDASTESREAFREAARAACEDRPTPRNTVIVCGVLVSRKSRETLAADLRATGREVVEIRAGAWMTLADLIVADRVRAANGNREPLPLSALSAMLDAANDAGGALD